MRKLQGYWVRAARMAEFLGSPLATLVIGLGILAMLSVGGIYVIGRVRTAMYAKEPTISQWLTKFQELRAKGELSDEEYRTIKGMLAEQLQQELNGTDETA